MTVRVLMFGPLAQELGERSVDVSVRAAEGGAARVEDVRAALAARFPSRAGLLGAARLAVNGRIAGEGEVVREADEVAVIELVGGG